MELESSSPYPQVPAICTYPEPTPSSPHDPLQLPEDPEDESTTQLKPGAWLLLFYFIKLTGVRCWPLPSI
jgi:hypothetical protein